jgi:hypothetical protein
MEDNKPSIEKILKKWKSEYGEMHTNENGASYPIIPKSRMVESLKSLGKTMLDYGWTFDEIDSTRVAVAVSNIVWREDAITKMSPAEIRKAKFKTTKDWEEAIAEFSEIIISKVEVEKPPYIPPTENKKEVKPEKPLELDPKDRIKMDTSDFPDTPIDLEFLKELGVDESFVNGKKDE